LILEGGDDLIEDSILFVSLGLVVSVNFTLVLEVSDGLLEGISGFLDDGQGLGLLGKGGLDLGGGSVGVEGLSGGFFLELADFSLRCGEPERSIDWRTIRRVTRQR